MRSAPGEVGEGDGFLRITVEEKIAERSNGVIAKLDVQRVHERRVPSPPAGYHDLPGGRYPTSPMLPSAAADQCSVASAITLSEQSTELPCDCNVVTGEDNSAAHHGAHHGAPPWVSLSDRVDLNGAATSDDGARRSTTEAHFQYGKLKAPTFASGRSSYTRILTFQHASGWEYGENNFFMDVADDGIRDGFNDNDVYLEWFSTLSLGKILGRRVGFGQIGRAHV